jgi:hypothetical protein
MLDCALKFNNAVPVMRRRGTGMRRDTNRIAMLVAVVLLAAVPAFAADVDGKWTGTLDTPMGPAMIGFTFKANGAALTGTTTSPDGGEAAIADGKIDGDKISFTVTLDFGGMPLMISYAGVVSGNQIKLTLDVLGMTFDVTVEKSK